MHRTLISAQLFFPKTRGLDYWCILIVWPSWIPRGCAGCRTTTLPVHIRHCGMVELWNPRQSCCVRHVYMFTTSWLPAVLQQGCLLVCLVTTAEYFVPLAVVAWCWIFYLVLWQSRYSTNLVCVPCRYRQVLTTSVAARCSVCTLHQALSTSCRMASLWLHCLRHRIMRSLLCEVFVTRQCIC
jgi:hypothetical protein